MRFEGVTDSTFRALVEEAHRVALAKAGDKIPASAIAFVAEIPIELSNRMTTTAGRVTYRYCPESRKLISARMQLNYRLLSRNPKEIFFTYAHELAHIIAEFLYGGRRVKVGHGAHWKATARALGDTGDRCHSMSTEGLRKPRKRHRWNCVECGTKLHISSRRHSNWTRAIASGGWVPRHICGAELDYCGSVSV
jgi:predicted SprT family Zn-dependent metalloprotease